jgi:hypothetical protein
MMSRHIYDTKGIRVVVGWDPPLQSFFVQRGVINVETGEWFDDSEPSLWLGTRYAEISSIQDMVDIDRGYQLGLSPELFKILMEDGRNDL